MPSTIRYSLSHDNGVLTILPPYEFGLSLSVNAIWAKNPPPSGAETTIKPMDAKGEREARD